MIWGERRRKHEEGGGDIKPSAAGACSFMRRSLSIADVDNCENQTQRAHPGIIGLDSEGPNQEETHRPIWPQWRRVDRPCMQANASQGL